jgi:pimeloyl-ACP methyl ester carboxylesterase
MLRLVLLAAVSGYILWGCHFKLKDYQLKMKEFRTLIRKKHLVVFQSRASNKTILFIHGLGGQKRQFIYQINHFVEEYTIVAADMVGHGQSANGTQTDYEVSNIAQDLCEIVKTYASKNVFIVCHSYGCLVGLELLQRLDNVSGICFICPKPAQKLPIHKILNTSNALLEFWRFFDRFGKIFSHSVNRFIGPKSSNESRWMQLHFNSATSTQNLKLALLGMPENVDYNLRGVKSFYVTDVKIGLWKV